MNLFTSAHKLFYKSLTFLLVFLSVAFFTQAQTPQYYNSNTPGNSNSFPFNQAPGKATQWLFLPGNLTQLPLATLWGPMDTVYSESSATFSTTAQGWFSITLETPYNYDPTKSLIVMVGQCGATGSGFSVNQTNFTGNRRNWSVGGCPFVPYAGTGNAAVVNCGVDVVNAEPYPVPDLIYYKFKNNPTSTATPNFAIPGVGANPAPFTTYNTLIPGGQFDSCLNGTGLSTSGIYSGWLTDLGAGSWTISTWLNSLPNNSTIYYLFGETNSTLRAFLSGVAGVGNIMLRGTGITEVLVTGVSPGPTVVHFVYDSASATIKAYKNGVLSATVPQSAPLNLSAGSGFRVGGYGSNAGLNGKMDEFRVYRRALSPAEVLGTWNVDLNPNPTVITPVNAPVPEDFLLEQNYPNPFNAITNVKFKISNADNVKLTVFDILGKEVAVLVNQWLLPGIYETKFNAENITSGIYFYKMTAGDFSDVKKMILIK